MTTNLIPLIYLTLSQKKKKKKKKTDFKAEPLMFLDLASHMKALYSTLEHYSIKQRQLSYPCIQF